jgi:hypothetical protein
MKTLGIFSADKIRIQGRLEKRNSFYATQLRLQARGKLVFFARTTKGFGVRLRRGRLHYGIRIIESFVYRE